VNVDLSATESFEIDVAVIPAPLEEENTTSEKNETDNSTKELNETETALPTNDTNSTEEEVAENKTEEVVVAVTPVVVSTKTMTKDKMA
jgi:hypothetical protein